MNGTAIISQSTVILLLEEPFEDDATRRIKLVQATSVHGAFNNIQIHLNKAQGKDGACHTYQVAQQVTEATSVSVILATTEVTCYQRNPRQWLMLGFTVGVIGLLVIIIGLLYLFRDIVMTIARRQRDEESYII